MMDKAKYDDRRIRSILNQAIMSEAFLVAYDIGLFEYISHHKKTIGEICSHHCIASRPMNALLSVVVHQKLVNKFNNFFSLSDYSKEYLLKNSPFYFGDILDLLISGRKTRSFDSIKESILTNRPQVYRDQQLFQMNEAKESLSYNFTKAMHAKSIGPALEWPEHVDLSEHAVFLDIGGGAGTHTISVCSKWENLRGIIFDRPFVCQFADGICKQFTASQHVCVCIGDMWQDTFPEADIHFYSDILHNWGIEKCSFLLKKSYLSLPANGKIIIHEMLYRENRVLPANVIAYNLNMLLWTEGQQFSVQELTSLLSEFGFTDITYRHSFGDWGILVGIKPK